MLVHVINLKHVGDILWILQFTPPIQLIATTEWNNVENEQKILFHIYFVLISSTAWQLKNPNITTNTEL